MALRMIMPGAENTSGLIGKIRDHLANNKSLFVRNMTKPRQVIFISWIPEGQQQRKSQNIANTFLPIEITRFISPKDLLGSDDFMHFIEVGTLVPIASKTAKEELASEDAVEEIERLKTQQGISTTREGRLINAPRVGGGGITENDVSALADYRKESEDRPEPDINRTVISVCGRMSIPKNDGGLSPAMCLAELKNTQGLKREDYAFLVAHGTFDSGDGTVNTRVSDWANAKLAALNVKKAAKTAEKSKKPKKPKSRLEGVQEIY